MKIIDINAALPETTAPLHEKVFSKSLVNPQLGAKVLSVAVSRQNKDGRTQAHRHPDSDHVIFVLKGEIVVPYKGEKIVLHPGQGIYCAPNEVHEMYATTEEDTVYLAILTQPLGILPAEE